MIPGVTNLPAASIVLVPAGALTVAPTPAIFPLWIQTLPCGMVPWVTVMTVAFWITRSAGVAEGACAARLMDVAQIVAKNTGAHLRRSTDEKLGMLRSPGEVRNRCA
jgi:hypothetical protein